MLRAHIARPPTPCPRPYFGPLGPALLPCPRPLGQAAAHAFAARYAAALAAFTGKPASPAAYMRALRHALHL